MRDFPELSKKPIAVGGKPNQRGVIATCNYAARQFGVRSAMSTAKALALCPNLIVRPGRMDVYREESQYIIIEGSAINSLFVKLKFNNFQQTTVEQVCDQINASILCQLIEEGYLRKPLPVRLLGIGVKLKQKKTDEIKQLSLFHFPTTNY